MTSTETFPSNRRWAAALILSLAVGAVFTAPASAMDKDKIADLERKEYVQERFLEDSEPPAPLQRMATTPCIAGFAGVYPCNNVDLMAFMPLASIGGGSGNDVWGWTDPLDGKEYALMGRSTGTAFIDVTDPANPVYLGNLAGRGSASDWRDIKVYSNHAYIVSESSGHGMQVFDLTLLRNVTTPPVQFPETAHYSNVGSAHNVAINEDTGFAYIVGASGCSGGPHFVDLSTPAAPVFAGCHTETLYTHDAHCVVYDGPDTDYLGREICVNSNTNRLNIIDVNDKAATTLISSTTYSGTGYTHQGWLTEDHHYYLQGDELDEQNFGHPTRTRIFDVRNLDAPVLIGTYDGSTNAIDHNLYNHNGYMYQANYRAGLQIFDLTDVSNGNLTEIASFDIYPSSNSANFSGAWSNYPFFASGTVLISGIGEGLFIVRPVLAPDFDLSVDRSSVSICDPGDDTVQVTVTGRNGFAENVDLSLSGLPPGAASLFTPTMVTLPADPAPTSDLLIDTASVPAGAYGLTVSATDGTILKEVPLNLVVSDAIPSAPILVGPADAAIDINRAALLDWSAVAQATDYVVELATDAGFGDIVFTTTTAGTSVIVEPPLDPVTTYYWRVRAFNACGIGVDSTPFSFTTLEVPRILLIDDDDNSPDVRASYVQTLTALGEDFDIWDTGNTDNEPNSAALGPYEVVIWFTGDEFGGSAGPGAGGEQALAAWLDQSACLLISSQDYYYDRGLTGFMQSHLGLQAATSDVTHIQVTGTGAVFGGLGPYSLSFPYNNYTDDLTADGTAAVSFAGDQGRPAIEKDGGVYRTSFWSFGLETLPTETDRQAALGAMLSWCATLPVPDSDSDGTNDDEDCAPADPDLWMTPSAAGNLRVDGTGRDTLTWSPPVAPGGNVYVYDVLRSIDFSDFAAGICVETGDTDTQAVDPAMPVPNELYSYLIRVRNDCGESMGEGTLPGSRNGGICQ